jgi:hypothetical protein
LSRFQYDKAVYFRGERILLLKSTHTSPRTSLT